MTLTRRGTYDAVAGEYYDAVRHPTSADFRAASDRILEAWLPAVIPTEGAVLDVGAGDSAVAAFFASTGRRLEQVILLDASAAMLEHSRRWIDRGATALVARAEELPIDDRSVGIVVASLGDPFNVPSFWSEVHRVLHPGAALVFTTPALEWAVSFRNRSGEPKEAAEFSLASGETILVPSYVKQEKEQVALMSAEGLRVEGVYHVLRPALHAEPSPKVRGSVDEQTPFVTGYLGRRAR